MTMDIYLSDGRVAKIDPDDYDLVSPYKWQPHLDPRTAYAYTTVRDENGRRGLLMHRLILGLQKGDPRVDHRDHDGLNNQRSNLRLATPEQNGANQRPRLGHKYRGVSYKRRPSRWQARIRVAQVEIYLGLFDTAEEAARAYNMAALNAWGEYACLNQVGDAA